MVNIIHLIFQKIYRCWIVWGYKIRVVIVPSFLAFAFLRTLIYLHSPTDFNLWFLAIWIAASSAPVFFVDGGFYTTDWSNTLVVVCLSLSMAVNTLVTGLIVFRIFKVFQEVKAATAVDQTLGMTGGSTLERVIFIIIESGMALFLIELARLVVTIVNTDAAYNAYYLVIGIHQILNVIIRLIIATVFYW